MTLEEMKKKTLNLIEEIDTENDNLTADIDIANKINDVINQIMFELCRYKKIPAYEKLEVKQDEKMELSELDNFYQLKSIQGVEFDLLGNTVIFLEPGTATIQYYKFPKRITEKNQSNYKFELSDDVLEIMPYGIAADLLKSDVSNQYGQVYANRYAELKQMLDPRYDVGSIVMEGGLDI